MISDHSQEQPGPKLAPAIASQIEANQTPDFNLIRQKLTQRVAAEAEQMVTDMIGHVKEGNVAAMKFLFEMTGLFPATAATEGAKQDSVQTRLEDYLGLSDESEGTRRAEPRSHLSTVK